MDYNNLMEAIYYIPYFATLDSTTSETLGRIKTQQPYIDMATMLGQSARSLANDAKKLSAEAPSKTTKADKIAQFNEALLAMQEAALELTRSYEVSAQSYAKKADVETAIASVITAINAINSAANTDEAAAVTAAIEVVSTSADTITAVAVEAIEAAKLADARTLYDIVSAIYTENGITPSAKEADWTKQKTVLLHKAETILMEDMPVIPVLFNQNAVMVSGDLTKVTSTYYIPAYFRKTNLKKYDDYTYVDAKGETVSIFAEFPTIAWDKIGK